MKLFKRKPSKSEISQYVSDLKDIKQLSQMSVTDEEQSRYNTMIKVMQEIVIRLGGKVK